MTLPFGTGCPIATRTRFCTHKGGSPLRVSVIQASKLWGLDDGTLRSERSGMGGDLAAVAEQTARGAAPGRSPGAGRDLLDAANGFAVARFAGALRPPYDGLQPLQSLGQGRRAAARFRDFGGAIAGFAASDRLLDRPCASTRRRRKKGGEDHAIGRSRGGLSTKIHAVVDAVGLRCVCC